MDESRKALGEAEAALHDREVRRQRRRASDEIRPEDQRRRATDPPHPQDLPTREQMDASRKEWEGYLEHMRIMRIQEGDTLVLQSPDRMSLDEMDRMVEELRSRFTGHDIVVLEGGMELALIRERLVVKEPGDAWLVVAAGSEMKACPGCGALNMEGQVQCTDCGLEPEDDHSWRVAGRIPRCMRPDSGA